MAKISFIVRSKIVGQPATVYLRYVEKGQVDYWIPTQEKVFPEYWSGNKGKTFLPNPAYTVTFTERMKVDTDARFMQLRQFISSNRLNLKGNLTKEWLKQIIDKYYNKSTGVEDLNSYIERFIKEITSGERLSDSRRYNHGTVKNYLGFQSMFNEFQGIYTEKRIKELQAKKEALRPRKIYDFNDITTDFYDDYMAYFNSKNYSPNTIGRHVSKLKVIMRESKEEGLHNNTEFTRKTFKAVSIEVQNVYLKEDELKLLLKLDLSQNKHLDIAKDVFLCGCFTAQRFSDYSRFNKGMVKTYPNMKVLEFIQTKTGAKCVVPIRFELDQILKKYDYTLPRTHEQKLNKYIKTICSQAGINEQVNIEEYRGGMKVKKTLPKYELIKTHTARRSGATNMKLAGVSNYDIMKIGGWKTEREFLTYLKMSQEETALSLAQHPFFIGNTPLSVAN
jgi:predicted transport protein